MAGIDKMTDAILADARAQAAKVIESAKAEAEKEKKAAKDAFEEKKAKSDASIDKELEDMRLRAESARDLMRRRMILEKKQEIISRIIEKIRVRLHDAQPGEYFENIYKMLEKYAQKGEGIMHLNSNDLGRLPSDFASRIQQITNSKGGQVEVSKEPYDIEDGFVLEYGGTQENCTFRSLIETQKESLYDEINRMLWREN